MRAVGARVPVAAWFLPASATAGTSKAAYDWHIADAFLEVAVESPPWAVAEADNGDMVLLDGTGVLDVPAKTASGGGDFIHLLPNGSTFATGTWTADRLVSFQFYGCGGPGLPDFLCGGLAKLHVTIHPDGTTLALPATLWVDCLLGDKIPSGGAPARAEGVRLSVHDLINFNHTHEDSGFTVFIPSA
jgi:hypothetical protein